MVVVQLKFDVWSRGGELGARPVDDEVFESIKRGEGVVVAMHFGVSDFSDWGYFVEFKRVDWEGVVFRLGRFCVNWNVPAWEDLGFTGASVDVSGIVRFSGVFSLYRGFLCLVEDGGINGGAGNFMFMAGTGYDRFRRDVEEHII